MPTDITRKTIIKAMADAKAGTVDITDSRGRGLILRGGPKGLTWQYRKQIAGKPRRLILGAVDRWSIEEARRIAGAAEDHVTTFGVMVDEQWLHGYLVSIGKIAADPVPDGSGGFPTFEEGKDEYLDYVKGHLKAGTVKGYRENLEHPMLQALNERRLPTITHDDAREIVLAIHATGKERTAELVASALGRLFGFFGEYGRRKRYGVEPGIMLELKAPPRTYSDEDLDDEDDDDDPWADGYVPEISELGRIIAVARSGLMMPTPAAAVELTCWTVQRRATIVGARIKDFVDLGNGTGLWRIPPASRKGVRKGKKPRPHVIPLPPPVWDCVRRAHAVATARRPDTRWLFPAARPRRKGDPVTHMHPSTLTHAFLDVPGCGASTHDVRRSMGTHGEAMLGFTRTETAALMDHAEGKKESDRITSRTAGTGTNDITGIHYSLHDGTHHTWPVMLTWVEALEQAIAEATERMEPMRELAWAFGDRTQRLGVGAKLMPDGVMTDEEVEEREATYQGRLLKVLGGGFLDDEEEEDA